MYANNTKDRARSTTIELRALSALKFVLVRQDDDMYI